MNDFSPKKDLFIAGSMDDFADQTAKNIIASQKTRTTLEDTQKTEYALAEHIFAEIKNNGNPIASVLHTDNGALSAISSYDDQDNNWSMNNRAISILSKQDEMHSIAVRPIHDQSDAMQQQFAQDYLATKIDQQIVLNTSQVTMDVCHRVMNGEPLSLDMVNEQVNKQIIEPLNEQYELQKEVAVKLVALNEVKESILSDMQHIEFQQAFHSQLKSTSVLNPQEINRIIMDAHNQNIEPPKAIYDLKEASSELYLKAPMISRTDDLVTTSEIINTLNRESIQSDSYEFSKEVARARLDIDQSFTSYLSGLEAKKEMKEPSNLTEMLKQLDSGSPSL